MYMVKKRMEIAGSHHLELDYDSKCQNLHGHNWIITVCACSKELNKNGMVIDFAKIKNEIHSRLDHKNLNEIFDFNPTAENIAKWICDKFDCVYKVMVQESEGNTAIYLDDKKSFYIPDLEV